MGGDAEYKKASIGDSTCLDAWSLIRTCMCLLGRVKRIVSSILNVQWSLPNAVSRNKSWHRMQIKVSYLGNIVASLTCMVSAVSVGISSGECLNGDRSCMLLPRFYSRCIVLFILCLS